MKHHTTTRTVGTQCLSWLALPVIGAVSLLVQTLPVDDGNRVDTLITSPTAEYTTPLPGTPPSPAAVTAQNRPVPAKRAPGNLWSRLHDGFALPADNSAAVQSRLETIARNPDNIEQILHRGRPYLYHILEEISHRGLPAELALLPMIESAFDPHARSPRNATGLWQFMPATARELGLRQDRWYDGRRDVIAATTAALDYLAQLHQRFDGDWLLALAAYNAGPGRVQQAIRHNLARGRPVDFWHLDLPDETRDYVPKLLALRVVLAAPQHWELDLPALPDAPWFTVVDSGGPLDLGVAARLAGVALEEIQRLNPAYTRQTIHHTGPRTLVLPKDAAPDFRTQLAGLSRDERVPWVRHRIRYGDTLSTIARQYRIPTAQLRAFNRLPDANIIAGDLLIVPVRRDQQTYHRASRSEAARNPQTQGA